MGSHRRGRCPSCRRRDWGGDHRFKFVRRIAEPGRVRAICTLASRRTHCRRRQARPIQHRCRPNQRIAGAGQPETRARSCHGAFGAPPDRYTLRALHAQDLRLPGARWQPARDLHSSWPSARLQHCTARSAAPLASPRSTQPGSARTTDLPEPQLHDSRHEGIDVTADDRRRLWPFERQPDLSTPASPAPSTGGRRLRAIDDLRDARDPGAARRSPRAHGRLVHDESLHPLDRAHSPGRASLGLRLSDESVSRPSAKGTSPQAPARQARRRAASRRAARPRVPALAAASATSGVVP